MTSSTQSPPRARQAKPPVRAGDRWFSGTALFAGSMILVTLAAVTIFLVVQSIPGITATSETASLLDTNFWDYVWRMLPCASRYQYNEVRTGGVLDD